MASTTCSGSSYPVILKAENFKHSTKYQTAALGGIKRSRKSCMTLRVFATQEQGSRAGADTRIHWDDPDEGWIGGGSGRTQVGEDEDLLADNFADLLKESSDSHYQFLGIATTADLEEIKTAYRRLSKEYHPDTTSLPIKTASEKFMKLRDIYDVLSNAETRKFYDWTLAQEAVSRQTEKLRVKLDDPYEQEIRNYKPVPDMVDRLGGRNMPLSSQAMTALTFDLIAIFFSFCCIVYVVCFKEQY